MCLDAHAHGMRIEHDIFRKPNRVAPTIESRPTPASYARYPKGRDLGTSMPMWRVQTEGYLDSRGQLVGVVSRDAGFFDSPDVEWISGGVNSKGPMAVALGRHGNFFHWGFAASPTYLTEEAKDVFVNAVHYISRFNGQTPIARKPSGIMIRSAVDRVIDGMSAEGYARTVAMYEGFRKQDEERKARIRKRVEAGEEVSKTDRRILGSPPTKIPGRVDGARRFLSPEARKTLGDDPDKIATYLRARKPFLRPNGWYTLVVDEELMQLGLANNDVAMLELLVKRLASGDENGTARTLLERYTAESFETAAKWNSWLKTNRERLFFTEAGGYKWLVNTRSRTAKPAIRSPLKATPRAPFASSLSLEPSKHGRYTLTVRADILAGWHAYDSVPSNSPYAPVKMVLELPEGVRQDGEWKRPVGHASIENPALTTFEGELEFQCELVATGLDSPSKIVCEVSYQVCDARMCMPPMSKRLTAVIKP